MINTLHMKKISDAEVEAWKRRKDVYERFHQGEKRPSIASDLGISLTRVDELKQAWKDLLEVLDKYPDRPRVQALRERLHSEGVLMPTIEVEYSYA